MISLIVWRSEVVTELGAEIVAAREHASALRHDHSVPTAAVDHAYHRLEKDFELKTLRRRVIRPIVVSEPENPEVHANAP